MTHLDTRRIAAAVIRSELRRERQRLNQVEPTPIKALATTTMPPASPTPRGAPADDTVSRNNKTGDD